LTFDAGADVFTGAGTYGWVAYGTNTIANPSNALVITYGDSGNGAYRYINASGALASDMTVGKSYRFSCDAKFVGGNAGVVLEIYGGAGYNQSSAIPETNAANISVEFTAGNASTPFVRLSGMVASNVVTLDNLKIVPIGAVAEYDGSGIASDKWFDKSGNDLHGTVSGATVENAPSGDDGLVYEEGTWTPAWVNGTGQSYSEQTGHYIRVGKMCTLWCQIVTSNMNSQTGDAEVGGLPFTANSSDIITHIGPINGDNGWDTNLSTNNLICLLLSGAATLKPRKNSGSNTATIQLEEIGGGDSYFCVTITYEVE
jgi:hypothetical protein